MSSKDGSAPKVPPLRIKNIRSLQTVQISDEEDEIVKQTNQDQQSSGNDSGSDGENLVIDESHGMEEADDDDQDEDEDDGGECMVIEDSGDESADDVIEVESTPSRCRQSVNSNGVASSRAEATPTASNSATVSTSGGGGGGGSSRSNRRKSHHVPKQIDELVFEEATITVLPDPKPDAGSSDREDPNKYLMKNIAMLKSCINYALEQQNHKPMVFKYNYECASQLIEQYNQIKKGDAKG